MSEAVESPLLNREEAIAQRMDPFGKKWEIATYPNRALYLARPVPYRSDYKCPKEFEGTWTSKHILEHQIGLYLIRVWDEADAARAKSERRAAAKAEAEARERKLAKERADKEARRTQAEQEVREANEKKLAAEAELEEKIRAKIASEQKSTAKKAGK